ncbi:MAG: DegT/DnrJ/EryC1/StrS family aminotransferase [Opitutaceae bacterium]
MKRINVTEPYLPPLEEYVEYLRGIWDRNWLTNQGPLVQEFEQKLQAYHQLSMPVHCVTNGSLGLQIAFKALGVSGEVITTPFSYVATTACPLWEGCSVKFADIELDTLTIDPAAVEAAITPKTEAILATHVFGNPCDVEALDAIGAKHGLAVIYDAAHAFGVRYKGKSILDYGDASMVSLHATKLMHSVEGGFVVAKDPTVAEKVEWMRRFGHNGEEHFHGVGINAKMSEFHAAMGLASFSHIDEILTRRRRLSAEYDKALVDSQVVKFAYNNRSESPNYAYYPVLFENEAKLLSTVERCRARGVGVRRYFWPALSDVMNCVTSNNDTPIAKDISNRILCLPFAPQYDESVVASVVESLEEA